jgi:uncharacterized phage infection (PIP) family protein YhgE
MMVGVFLFALPLAASIASEPAYMQFLAQQNSFLEQDPNQLLNTAINDVAERQKQMHSSNAKQLNDEAGKQAKLQADFDKVANDMKAQIDQLAKKLQETEQKAADAEAKVQPAKDDAMKQAIAVAEKAMADEMAKEKSEQDGLVKKLNDEVSKGQKNAAGF